MNITHKSRRIICLVLVVLMAVSLIAGAIMSNPAHAASLADRAVVITAQPTDISAPVGQKAVFTISAAGNNLSYCWQFSADNGKNWLESEAQGSASTALTINVTAGLDGRMYRCLVSDGMGQTVISDSAILRVTNGSGVPAVTPAPEPGPAVTPAPEPAPGPLMAIVNKSAAVSGVEVPVASATASSELYERGANYGPTTLYDHSLTGIWKEGTKDVGEGEWVQLDYGRTVSVSQFQLYLGYWFSKTAWQNNFRPASMTISFSDGSSVECDFDNDMSCFTVELSRPVSTKWARFTINSVYNGYRFRDCVISEITTFSGDASLMDGRIPNLSISGASFPYEVTRGVSCDIGGYVRTDVGTVTSLTCTICDMYGSVVQTYTDYPNTFEVNVLLSPINYNMRFASLGLGNYSIRLSATASNGYANNTMLLVDRVFTVKKLYLPEPTDFCYTSHAPFYGIFCQESTNYAEIVTYASQLAQQGFDARIIISSEWSWLNQNPRYAVTCGIYYSKEEAEAMLPYVQAVYPAASLGYAGIWQPQS